MANDNNVATSGGEHRSARMDLRLTPTEKQLIAMAARHQEMDASAFARHALVERARAVVEGAQRIMLSERDFVRVTELLEDPPEPGTALRSAVERRRR